MKLNAAFGLSASWAIVYFATTVSGSSLRSTQTELRRLQDGSSCGEQGCGARQKCVLIESTGEHECICEDGYVGHLCLFTQCASGLCTLNQDCIANVCTCKPGYTGSNCHDDVDECLESQPCSFEGGYCENRWAFDGFYACGCDTANGWMDGDTPPDAHGVTSCKDSDECSNGDSPCHENASCINLLPGFMCMCNDGLVGDGIVTCAPPPPEVTVDPCEVRDCDQSNSFCQLNLDGIAQCLCKSGFSQIRPDSACKDENECSDPSSCPHGASCVNLDGGFECLCDPGYAGGGDVCTDIDECTLDPCATETLKTQCVNTDGSFECIEPTPAPTPQPTPSPTNAPAPRPIPSPPGPLPAATPVGPAVESTTSIGGQELELAIQAKSDGSFDVEVANVGTITTSGGKVSFAATNAPDGQPIQFSIPLPESVGVDGTTQNAAILAEFVLAQLTAAAAASDDPERRGRKLDSPGCDLFPDATCNLGCCALHDQCYDLNGCTALSWARTICEPALAAGFVGAVDLGTLGTIFCTPSLLFINGKCSQCNSAAVACIALGCSGLNDTNSEVCYDNICNSFYECPGNCTFVDLTDDACCGCQAAGNGCSAPPTCGNGICDFGETSDNCLTDCAFTEGCSEAGFINCGSSTCVDPLNNVDNCGACGISCPSSVSGIANACVLGSCTIPVGISWETNVAGILADGGWQISNDGKTIRYSIEDSENCGGPNNEIQTGTANATIDISETLMLTLEIIGIAELQDGTFELMDVYLDDDLVVSATSTNNQLMCEMGPSIFTETVPGPYTLTPGQHTFEITFTTNDALFHVNAFYELNLIFMPTDAA